MSVLTTDIQDLIPQQPPFVMIDCLMQCDEALTRTGFEVKADNVFVTNHQFAEPGLVENIAQTAAARLGWFSKIANKPVAVGFIGAVKDLEINELPKVGDHLETDVYVENQIFDVTVIKGQVRCQGRLLAQCEMKIFINPNQS
jgi:predicted hotdog family 3-hydroxylacyl-ACP dehydratase